MTNTKEPADWAKIKAYRAAYPKSNLSDTGLLEEWKWFPQCHELARYIDKYDKPPVDPDLLAAREWLKCEEVLTEDEVNLGL